ncbi:PAS domain-containing protein [Aquibaculum sediminis]|uniref:PAS domain-containing protein n=1 Tax=Aquibaculum sediminis TaxID=3231907 RepID=UPI003454330B
MPLIDLNEISSPLVLRAYDYWKGKHRNGHLPARADIDPLEIPELLPNVLISQAKQDPFSIVYRLAGTEVVAMNKMDLTGKPLNYGIEQPAWRQYWRDAYWLGCSERRPIFGADTYEYRDREHVNFEWCILPLAQNGVDVDMFFEIEAYAEGARAGRGVPVYTGQPSE